MLACGEHVRRACIDADSVKQESPTSKRSESGERFNNTQGKDFEFQTFDLDTDYYTCNGDCCVCDYFASDINDIDGNTNDSLHQLMCEVIEALF